ncbi:hypothetical protein CBER1_10988 [Cercospora berteroae]|uniref:Chromo domain-containing protein n=1 Tax=Cercospora berteroae TaxID=357750 RepID=A0A2S6BXF1_9PEZI|nr:hypothetical protein CBER1_10988 [Cercospora berteroae]
MPPSMLNDRSRQPQTPYPYENLCPEHIDCTTSRADGDFEPGYVTDPEAFAFGNDFAWQEVPKTSTEALNAAPHSAARVAPRPEIVNADTTTNPRVLGSPFVVQRDEKPQVNQDMHVQWPSSGKRARSGDHLVNERPIKRPRPLVISTGYPSHPCHWVPKTPECPSWQFQDIVAERQSAHGTEYNVEWRNSWVLQSQMPDVTPVLRNHIKRFGRPWEGYSQHQK